MRSVRLTMAAIAATALLAFLPGAHAGAQQAFDVTTDFECNTDTGEYEFTILLENFIAEEADVDGEYDYDTASGASSTGDLDFDPDPVPGGETTTAVVSAPGDTILFEALITVVYEEFDDVAEVTIELGEECVPTTTTSSTTTTAPPEESVQPRFTG